MITTTWMNAPADLLAAGGFDASRYTALERRTAIAVSLAPCVAPVLGTGVPAGSTAVRLRPELRPASTFAHDSIDTTLGNCSSRRPLS